MRNGVVLCKSGHALPIPVNGCEVLCKALDGRATSLANVEFIAMPTCDQLYEVSVAAARRSAACM